MEYGIFASIYGTETASAAAKKISEAGLVATQLNTFIFEGKPLDPKTITEKEIKRIRKAFESKGVKIVALGSYGRFVSPDKSEARDIIDTTKEWIKLAKLFGADVVVTEAGSKHAENNWLDCKENKTAATWKETVAVYKELTDFAKEYGVQVAIEPHFGQVVKGATELRKLLDDVKADNLKVVFDPANSVTYKNADNQEAEIRKFFDLLKDDIVMVHAKDAFIKDKDTVLTTAGKGILPYRTINAVLKEYGYDGIVLLEWLGQKDVDTVLKHVKGENLPPYLIPFAKADPVLFENAYEALNLVHASEGALDLKYRLLLSMVADALMRHPAGAIACAKESIEAGATKEEVLEAIRVVYTAGGLPTLIENFDLYREVILK